MTNLFYFGRLSSGKPYEKASIFQSKKYMLWYNILWKAAMWRSGVDMYIIMSSSKRQIFNRLKQN